LRPYKNPPIIPCRFLRKWYYCVGNKIANIIAELLVSRELGDSCTEISPESEFWLFIDLNGLLHQAFIGLILQKISPDMIEWGQILARYNQLLEDLENSRQSFFLENRITL